MKKSNLSLLILFVTLCSHAQIKFETSSLRDAILEAKKENKLIFLQIESADCNQCNQVADKAFENPLLNILEKNFVFLKVSSDNADRITIDKQYNTANAMGTLFLNSDGILIHRFRNTTSLAGTYIEQSNIAIKRSQAENIGSLNKMYESGNRDIDFMEKYITKTNELALSIDDLLDEYVLLIPVDSLKSLRVLKFILSNAPMIYSKADTVLKHDYSRFIQVWNSLSLQERVRINSRIIDKSKQKAIDTKDLSYLYRVASFTKGTYSANSDAGEKYFQQTYLNYYKAVKDTVNYIPGAVKYYDRFLMTVSVEQTKKTDSLQVRNLLENTPGGDTVQGYHSFSIKKIISFTPQAQFIANELNNGAWNLYHMTNDIAFLNKALQWAKRATEFYESPEDADTYAHLLYKTGNKAAAIEQEKKAITLQAKKGFPTSDYEMVLNKMKNNSIMID